MSSEGAPRCSRALWRLKVWVRHIDSMQQVGRAAEWWGSVAGTTFTGCSMTSTSSCRRVRRWALWVKMALAKARCLS